MPRRTADADENDAFDVTPPARSRALRVAREGFTNLAESQAISERRRSIAQYRACRALLWTREQILEETGWTLQNLMAVEKLTEEADLKIWERGIDPISIFCEYRDAQFLAARELEELALAFKDSKQFSALVGAVKARSEILDKVIKTGQELGLIKRAAREIRLHGEVDIRKKSVKELRVILAKEVRGLRRMLGSAAEEVPENTPAAAVFRRLIPAAVSEPIEAEAETVEVKEPRKPPRVKRLAG